MTDYTEMIRQLKTYEDGYGLYTDAAAAIEELQADNAAIQGELDALRVFTDEAQNRIEELQAEVDKWQDVAYQDSLEQMKMQERIWELEALKEAHIKPSYGEWLTVEVNPLDRMHNPIYECTCSRCHKEYTLATIPNYCPNCGAKMGGTDEVHSDF